MMRRISPGKIDGMVRAPSSKSMMQRAVAAAALAKGTSRITNLSDCDDALASIACARRLGAKIARKGDALLVQGMGKAVGGTLHCGESGLCMRMFSPIAALFGKEVTITGKGSLLSRPAGMVCGPLEKLGAKCRARKGHAPLAIRGPLQGGRVGIDGSVSSQFLTGLLMALPLCKKDSAVKVNSLKSRPYVRMTLELLNKFGIKVRHTAGLDRFEIPGNQAYRPTDYSIEGDWSGAAFLLVAGAVAGSVRVDGLDGQSLQADRAVLDALRKAGARVGAKKGEVLVEKRELNSFEFDATDCPDLFPPLVALACSCRGTSRIIGAGRLTGKESDRASALAEEFGKLGGKVRVIGDAMEIEGCKLRGGEADSHNDHRIAMACAIAALNAQSPVSIKNDKCVSKSYPDFFGDLESLRVKT